jgi:formyl-CoA transferase/CoA:oxalate CoA-transferase
MIQALEDLTVLEVGTTVVAPYATQMLGALGAEIIKIEKPGGDPFRGAAPEHESGMSGYFAMCNTGKRSITLDLKDSSGKEAFLKLATQADVVVENLRPGTVDKLGIGYDDVQDSNENLIYCSISGYGQEGEWSQLPGFDPILQGVSGLMSVTGEKDGEPVRIGVAIADLATAMWTSTAILNAIRHRDKTGNGTYIDMSMYDVCLSLLTKKAAHYLILGENPSRMGTEDVWAAPYGGYPTKDGRQIMIGTPRQSLWERLCKAIGHEDLIKKNEFATNEKRVENREELNEVLEEIFQKKDLDEWLDILQEEIPSGPIYNVEEALTSDLTRERDIIQGFQDKPEVLNLPLRFDGQQHSFETPPPEQGEHTRDVLTKFEVPREIIEDICS